MGLTTLTTCFFISLRASVLLQLSNSPSIIITFNSSFFYSTVDCFSINKVSTTFAFPNTCLRIPQLTYLIPFQVLLFSTCNLA